MEQKITESAVVGYLTPENQLQRDIQRSVEPQLTNRQIINNLQVRLAGLMTEVKQVQHEIQERWQEELR